MWGNPFWENINKFFKLFFFCFLSLGLEVDSGRYLLLFVTKFVFDIAFIYFVLL